MVWFHVDTIAWFSQDVRRWFEIDLGPELVLACKCDDNLLPKSSTSLCRVNWCGSGCNCATKLSLRDGRISRRISRVCSTLNGCDCYLQNAWLSSRSSDGHLSYASLSSPLISSVLRHDGVLLQCRRIGLLQNLGSEVVCWFVAHVHVHLLPLHRN